MVSNGICAARALFRSISDDGTTWLFVIGPDGGWAITRNDEQIAAGERHLWSLESGVRKFVCRTAAVAVRADTRSHQIALAASA